MAETLIPVALTLGLLLGATIRRRHQTAGECLLALCGGILSGYLLLWAGWLDAWKVAP